MTDFVFTKAAKNRILKVLTSRPIQEYIQAKNPIAVNGLIASGNSPDL